MFITALSGSYSTYSIELLEPWPGTFAIEHLSPYHYAEPFLPSTSVNENNYSRCCRRGSGAWWPQACRPGKTQWAYYGGDPGGQQYSPLTQINTDNVQDLTIAWQYRTGELERRTEFQNATAKVQVNPILLPDAAGGHLVLCTPFSRIIALDPATGQERWIHEPNIRIGGYATQDDPEGLQSAPFALTVAASHTGKTTPPRPRPLAVIRILTATHDLKLIAVDARNGELCVDFGADGIVDVERSILEGATTGGHIGEVKFPSPPVIINDVVAVGSTVRDNHRWNAPSGAVRAFDVRTGKPRWTFDPIPRDPGDPVYAEWTEEAARIIPAAVTSGES